jgi:hypothetical protein
MSIHDVTAGKHAPREFNVIVEDVPEIRLKQIQHFFEHYKDLEAGKWVKVLGWSGVELAHAEILDGIKRHRAQHPTRP